MESTALESTELTNTFWDKVLTNSHQYGKSHPSTAAEKTAERVYLDALSSKIVKIKCQDEEGRMFGNNKMMIATIENPHSLVTEPPGLIKVNKEGFSNDSIAKFWTFWNLD